MVKKLKWRNIKVRLLWWLILLVNVGLCFSMKGWKSFIKSIGMKGLLYWVFFVINLLIRNLEMLKLFRSFVRLIMGLVFLCLLKLRLMEMGCILFLSIWKMNLRVCLGKKLNGILLNLLLIRMESWWSVLYWLYSLKRWS